MRLFSSASCSDIEVTNLEDGAKYIFQVTAINTAGESQKSVVESKRAY